jgi:N-formylmaleamate deformylase
MKKVFVRTSWNKPVLIGHSLSGFISFWLASTEPHLVGKVVSVDGLPALGAMMNPDVTPEQLAQQADGMHMMLAAQGAEQFAAQTKLSMAGMITRPEENESIITAAVKSDPATVAQAVKELMATDLRKEVKKIKSPVLLMAASAGMPEAFASTVKDRYEAQIAANPNHEVVVATNARHFVMLDDPQFFFATLDKFLATAKSERKLVEKTR